jgi:glutathione S-transferase
MPELYYFHDATCGIKARLALFEKGVDFQSRILDRFELTTPDYLALNPKGVVPTLLHRGNVIVESSVICLYVDDAFDGPPLKPATAIDRARMYLWLKDIDERYFKGIGSTTFGLAVRKVILEKYSTDDLLEAYFQSIRIEEYRNRRRSIVAHGLEAPEVHQGLRVLASMIVSLNEALAESEFAAGPDYSLADACLTPFIMRLEVFGLQAMWAEHRRVSSWWSAIKQRPSYQRLLEESFPPEYQNEMHARVGNVWPRVNEILSENIN